jgi:ABC-type siderophore export system fused ATPase/permease subunit
MYFASGERAVTMELVMFFLTEALLVGIGWLPFWIMIATVAVMAIAVALLGTHVVTGG